MYPYRGVLTEYYVPGPGSPPSEHASSRLSASSNTDVLCLTVEVHHSPFARTFSDFGKAYTKPQTVSHFPRLIVWDGVALDAECRLTIIV
jgi:hypothetical protein